jgi:hypothetical protein
MISSLKAGVAPSSMSRSVRPEGVMLGRLRSNHSSCRGSSSAP